MEKTLEELKFVMKVREKDLQNREPLLAICLSSRRNMCIHPEVSKEDDRVRVDSLCRSKTASWVRNQTTDIEDIDKNLCRFYEGFWKNLESFKVPKGVYTLDDLKELGQGAGMCPYFLARHYLNAANVIVYNYSYMIDPKISNLVSKELSRECIVVFDECHNIDNVCIESFSININNKNLSLAANNLKRLEQLVSQERQFSTSKLQKEYQSLVKGLVDQDTKGILSERELLAHPLIEKDVIKEAIPGNIRKADHFLAFLRRIIAYLKEELKSKELKIQTPLQLIYNLQSKYLVD